MGETKRTGKALLRPVDGFRAAGVCQYAIDARGMEANVSAQFFEGGMSPMVVLQSGSGKGYQCGPPAPLSGPVRSGADIAAVWVTDAGKPALFAQIAPGAFDMPEARKRLAAAEQPNADAAAPREEPRVSALSFKAATAEKIPMPSFREPETGNAAAPAQPPEPILLLRPGVQPPQENAAAEPAAKASARPQAPGFQPLVIRRAPRPTPRPPVYSPLWDDVSAEFEKMLESLPRTQPFNGNAEGAKFAEMPLAGAVQCYIGSVEVKGMKVFLQAVPARPFARPAGFDHSLVSRDGETFWVKYFIQNQ
jgi:hypothetical protein